ncbi:MAG TPA: hypothetical protein VHU19_05560 [Pyrinomonadaceae bacterium]|jgi:hypothetical protein|nr:hypothetical protein [Pyrinomonadaceae bacterium]
MKGKVRFGLLCLLCCVALAASSQSTSHAGGAGSNALAAQYIQGTVVGISGRDAGRSRPFSLVVNRYTSPDDIARLTAAMPRGQDALLDVLSKLDAGRISLNNNVGVTANVIVSTPTAEGGTKVTVLYQRTINFYELRYGARSEDYKFGYAEIYLNRNGTGEGTFIPAAKVRLRDGNTWEVEDFGEFPARLMGLRVRGSVGVAR